MDSYGEQRRGRRILRVGYRGSCKPIGGCGRVGRADASASGDPAATAAVGVVVGPDPRRRGGTIVHDVVCPEAIDGGKGMGTVEALDALMRPGASPCHECCTAEILLPAAELGKGDG
ncbi:DUF6233 domain-containing protein [Streptomyces sp. NPDC047072]|uniref:DUF6233 domain-containing protein n=1 Tax=Streptomyces sp. NPDC047072 TaxID=3154809 RepID=UPI0033F6AAF9